ncbi:hypothetical protein ACLOJK_010861 [Asimina triloba]
MLSYICLRYTTEGLNPKQIWDSLPKAIGSNIAHYLFFPIVQKADLFQGVSYDFLSQLVSEMQAEYLPPKEYVILQNEAPTDFYIVASGSMDLIANRNGADQIQGRAFPGEVFGEIGVLCNKPQPFTAQTRELSQILRLSRASLTNIINANLEDGSIIMNNLAKLQQLKGIGSMGNGDINANIAVTLNEWLDKEVKLNKSNASCLASEVQVQCQGHSICMSNLSNFHENAELKLEDERIELARVKAISINRNIQSQTTAAASHDATSWLPEIARNNSLKSGSCLHSSGSIDSNSKRVTIHMNLQKANASREQPGKLINLPDSVEEILRSGGQKVMGSHPTKVVNNEHAEINDLSVVQDGEHVFLIEDKCEHTPRNET